MRPSLATAVDHLSLQHQQPDVSLPGPSLLQELMKLLPEKVQQLMKLSGCRDFGAWLLVRAYSGTSSCQAVHPLA